MQDLIYDLIIIGGGPAGLTAGIYASRAKLKTLLIEKMGCGGNAAITDRIENYPGFPEGIGGLELASKFEGQAKKFGLEIKLEEVKKIITKSKVKTIITDSAEYLTKTIIVATGASYKKADVPGENEFIGKGVSYCATCDGPFFKEKEVVVIGGGDSAIQEADFLTKFAKKVTVIHRRDKLRATKILQEKVLSNPKVFFAWNSVITKILGSNKVEGIEIKNVNDNETSLINADGVFVFIGFSPNTSFIADILKLDNSGCIVTDDNMKTSVEGIYASGDCRRKLLNQVVTAASDGAIAAVAVQQYLDN
ncbi:MAG: thioredoxin-disulfide reductase [Elusimicrobia bacterium]|nr:thioredoxin-disulfide reductase [Elusimicrobiota bacterium]